MIYFQSTSNSAGQVNVTVTFEKGTNPDIAQVQVQNKVQQALPAPAAGGAAAGPDRHQVQPRLPADRLDLRRDRPQHERATSPTTSSPTCRSRSAASRASATSMCSARSTPCGSGSTRSSWPAVKLMPSDVISRDPGPEHPGRGGPDRRPAVAADPDAERHGHRPLAPDHARPVPQDHRQDPDRRFAGPAAGRRPRRAGQRELQHAQPPQRPPGRRHRRVSWRRAPTR